MSLLLALTYMKLLLGMRPLPLNRGRSLVTGEITEVIVRNPWLFDAEIWYMHGVPFGIPVYDGMSTSCSNWIRAYGCNPISVRMDLIKFSTRLKLSFRALCVPTDLNKTLFLFDRGT